MLRNELKKLFIKQYGLIMIIFLIIAESTVFLFLYKEKPFDNETERQHFNFYMEKMQGMLTDEKEAFILNEQEAILSAESELRELQRKLYSGKINDESEYDILFADIQNELQKKGAFDMAFSKYKYAAQNPEKRYIISADCDGVCRDYPDIPALILITAYGALFFSAEESSKMITLIRSCTYSKKNIFFAKLGSFFIMIFSVQLVISVCEMIFICNEIGTEKLNYPLQSLEYFGGCRYNITILDAYICIQFLKLAGLLFIGSLTAAVVIIFKKSVPAVSCSL